MSFPSLSSPVATTNEPLSPDDQPMVSPPRSLWGRVVVGLALLAILAGYAWLLLHWFAPAIQHPDANGYLAQATLLAQTGRTWFTPDSNAQYVGMHWLLTEDGRYACRYPPGMAVLIAPINTYFGWKAALLVNPVLALLTLLGVFFIVRHLASGGWGLVAVLALVVTPAFTEFALTNIAHLPVAFCLTWGVALLLWWSSRGRWWLAFLAGVVLGSIPTFRYPDATIAGGVALFLLMHWRKFPHIGRHYVAALAGAMVPILPLLVRNQLVFGAFWRTGYALTNEQTGFSWDYFRQHWQGYLQMLQSSGLGLWFGLGLIGMAWMTASRRTRAAGLMLATTTVPFVALYMAYYWAPGMGDAGGPGLAGPPGGGPGGGSAVMRFLVPLVPIFAVTAAWALAQALAQAPRAAKVAVPAMVVGMQLLLYGPNFAEQMGRMHAQKELLALATDGLENVAERDAVVVANNGLLQHLDFVRHWKLADPAVIRSGGGPGGGGPGMGGPPGGGGGRFGGRSNDPYAPSPGQTAKNQARSQLYTGTLRERQEQFLHDLSAWSEGREIYVVGNASDYLRILPGVEAKDLTVVLRIKTPAPPPNAILPRERSNEAASRPADNNDLPDRPDVPPGPDNFGRPDDFGPPTRLANARRGFAGPGGRGGGPFGPGLTPGEDIVIAKVKIPAPD